MTSLPIPFVVAFFVFLIAASNHHHLKSSSSGQAFAAVLYLYAFSMLLIGLRWSLGWVALMPIAATIAVTGCALLYLAYCSLGRSEPVISFPRDTWHLLPVVSMVVCALLAPYWLDLVLVVSKLLYALLLARLAQKSPVSLQLVRLSWLSNTQLALWGTAAILLISALVDIVIAVDFALYEGRHSASVVGVVNLLVLLLLGWATAAAGRARANAQQVDSALESNNNISDVHNATDATAENDAQLLEALDSLLIDQRLYADSELNLQKLARKASVPSRKISRVINAQTGLNMSQWVNRARIDAVCDLLTDETINISDAMLEAGFLTKSNFNREFRRLKGCSPSEWREKNSR